MSFYVDRLGSQFSGTISDDLIYGKTEIHPRPRSNIQGKLQYRSLYRGCSQTLQSTSANP